MPEQNPIARIELVARDLGRLAHEIEDYAGPDARRVLLHWQAELQAAADQIQRARGGDEGEPDKGLDGVLAQNKRHPT